MTDPAGGGGRNVPAAYYNEIDPYVARWLRNLISEGIIAPGEVDERPVQQVRADDLAGFTQCHFFAGVGGWSYALRLAGWPDDRSVWTGSCPCQPFSNAGHKKGLADPRHLWPYWQRLIGECRPATLFGEQSADSPEWITLVRRDLESMGFAVGCLPIEAASAGADHLRNRYWFVADCNGQRHEVAFCECGNTPTECQAAARNRICLLALGHYPKRRAEEPGRHDDNGQEAGWDKSDSRTEQRRPGLLADIARERWGEVWSDEELRRWRPAAAVCSIDGRQIIECPDGKWRRLPPPRVRWLGTRLPARIPRLRAFGNAIDPRPASAFISAFMRLDAAGGGGGRDG